MAEDDLTPEQLAAIAAENDVGETVNYKPPAQKTLQEIQELDQDDESLRKYKEVLLGAGAAAVAGECVCVISLSILVFVCVSAWHLLSIFTGQ
jgi:Rho GDP-dissociation inhibitor